MLLLVTAAAVLSAQNAVRTNAGFSSGTLEEGDSSGSALQLLGFTANFYGRNFTTASVNSDGMLTLGVISVNYRYVNLRELAQPGLTPFWSDAHANANTVTFGRDTVNGRAAFAATWNGIVPYAPTSNTPKNVFQLVLIDRSDTGEGNFDFEFNYNSIAWECSNNNRGCTNGAGLNQARAGWTTGIGGSIQSAFELDGSDEAGLFLDSKSRNLGLGTRTMDSGGVAGRLVFQVRGGVVQNAGKLPQITSITNAASFASNFAPNGFFTIFGSNFTTLVGPWDKFIQGSALPVSIRNLRVRVNDQDAFIYYFSPGQLNVLAPPGAYSGNVEVQVTNGLGSSTQVAAVNRVSPGWFAYTLGQKKFPAAHYAGSTTYVAAPGALAGVQSRPCRAGDAITLYATGLGATNPATPAGQVLPVVFPIDNPNRLRIVLGGQTANILFAGMTYAGVFQINITIPTGIASGDLPLRLEADGVPAQEAYLTCAN